MIGGLFNHRQAEKTERLILMGASGSVGSTALRFLKNNPGITLAAFSVHSSADKIPEIISSFQCRSVSITDEASYDRSIDTLKSDFPDCRFYRGEEGSLEMISECSADTILTAVVGACGIKATVLGIKMGLKIALANKETLVTAGPAIESLIDSLEKKPVILPVDSEHNSIFQLIEGLPGGHLSKIILTASGGPFRDWPLEKIKNVKRDEVLNHPTWSMGPKITVDSAGMINKGLEIIEAHHLFSAGYELLDAVIHKDSFVHGMVKTKDGAYLLAASKPDMIFPVGHSLMYPESVSREHESFSEPPFWPALQFQSVEMGRYPGFRLALEAGKTGGTAPAVFNAANEIAVDLFLNGNIEFTDIPHLIELVLSRSEISHGKDLDLYLQADHQARELTRTSADSISRI